MIVDILRDGETQQTISKRTINLEANTFVLEEYGVIVESRPLTTQERQMYGPQPLDTTGALATLLAVESVLTVEDAANAVGLTPQDLITEAEAWSVGS